jgi:hypothetical protein
MQELFAADENAVKAFRAGLSEERFAPYLQDADGDVVYAINLYLWNIRLSQSFYLPLQMWEILFRNKLNVFLGGRYGRAWPYEARPKREFRTNEYSKLKDARTRQERQRKLKHVPTGAIVADLSSGFWVALLSKAYDIPFAWRNNLSRIFPKGSSLDRATAHALSLDALDLRNRVAHHEPIYCLDITLLRSHLDTLIEAMCPVTNTFVRSACNFDAVWNNPPNSSLSADQP